METLTYGEGRMRQRPNPARKYPSAKKDRPRRKRVSRRPHPILVTIQEVHCKDCRRKYELHPLNPQSAARFCIWCRSESIQITAKTRRETPAERSQRETEMTGRLVNAAMHIIGGLFGGFVPPPEEVTQQPPSIRNGSPLEAELLKEGYRKLAQKYHPDKGGDPEKMKELNRLKDELGL